MKSSILNKKSLIIVIGLSFLALVLISLPRFLSPNKNRFTGTVPNNPASKICQKISKTEDLYYCLAVVNQDTNFCQNLDEPSQKELCQGMAARNVSYCRKIQKQEPRKMCFYGLAEITQNIDYCDEAEDKEHCYFNVVSGLHWAQQSEKITTESCNKFSVQSPDRKTCLALKENNISFCEKENAACLTLFEQPLSFCNNIKAGDKLKCIRDRAIIAKNPAICEKAANQEIKDECYFGYASHFDPKVFLCEKITDEMKKNMCYTEIAIKLSKH